MSKSIAAGFLCIVSLALSQANAINLQALEKEEPPLGFESKSAALALAVKAKAKEIDEVLLTDICTKNSASDCEKLKGSIRLYVTTYAREDWTTIRRAFETENREAAKKLEECFSLVVQKHSSTDLRYTAEKIVSFCSKEITESSYLLARLSFVPHQIAEMASHDLSEKELVDAFEKELNMRRMFRQVERNYRSALGIY